jgi:hypothetical protein
VRGARVRATLLSDTKRRMRLEAALGSQAFGTPRAMVPENLANRQAQDQAGAPRVTVPEDLAGRLLDEADRFRMLLRASERDDRRRGGLIRPRVSPPRGAPARYRFLRSSLDGSPKSDWELAPGGSGAWRIAARRSPPRLNKTMQKWNQQEETNRIQSREEQKETA